MKHLSETISNACQTEFELGIKTRFIDKINYQVKMAELISEKLKKLLSHLESENESLKNAIIDAKEE